MASGPRPAARKGCRVSDGRIEEESAPAIQTSALSELSQRAHCKQIKTAPADRGLPGILSGGYRDEKSNPDLCNTAHCHQHLPGAGQVAADATTDSQQNSDRFQFRRRPV